MTPETTPRRPGRPRSARAERAIHNATLELLVEQGYEGMSIEAVAARAGVGKATIYRRYDGKEALVTAALRSLNPTPEIVVPDTGSVREDFHQLIRTFAATTFGTVLGPMIVRLLSAIITNPDLLPIFTEHVIAPRRNAALEVFRRGVERGELRADLDLERMLDMLVGAIFFRVLFDQPTLGELPEVFQAYIDMLLRGAAPSREQLALANQDDGCDQAFGDDGRD